MQTKRLAVVKVDGALGQGSGVIFAPRLGVIVTVNHLTEDEAQGVALEQVAVEWEEGVSHPTEVIGRIRDPEVDIAFLRVSSRRSRRSLRQFLRWRNVFLKGPRLFREPVGLALAGEKVQCQGYPGGTFTSQGGWLRAIATALEIVIANPVQTPYGYSGGAVAIGAQGQLLALLTDVTSQRAVFLATHQAQFKKRLDDVLKRYRRPWRIFYGVLLALTLSLGGLFQWHNCQREQPVSARLCRPPIYQLSRITHDLIFQGEYLEARKALRALQTEYPENARLQRLLERLERHLDLQPMLLLPPGQGQMQGEVLRIRSNQGFQLQVTPSDTCHLYIYQLDAHNNLAQLFPNPKTPPASNPLQAGTVYQMPAQDKVFLLDQHSGQETLYFVASRWPARDLEATVERFHRAAHGAERAAALCQLEVRLKARQQVMAAGLAGVIYKEYAFWHDDALP